jgi:hypothetical protein
MNRNPFLNNGLSPHVANVDKVGKHCAKALATFSQKCGKYEHAQSTFYLPKITLILFTVVVGVTVVMKTVTNALGDEGRSPRQ